MTVQTKEVKEDFLFIFLKENVDCKISPFSQKFPSLSFQFLNSISDIHRFKNARDNLFFAMSKKDLETRHKHQYPGYKKLDKLNNKFRDIDMHGQSSFKGSVNSQTFRTMGQTQDQEAFRKTRGNYPVRGWDLGPGSLGPRWTQNHWEQDSKSRSDFRNTQEECDQEECRKTSIKVGGKNLRTKNVDGRMK